VAVSCEYVSETSRSINGGKFLGQLSDYQAINIKYRECFVKMGFQNAHLHGRRVRASKRVPTTVSQ
jgi:hypothetical protein